MTINRKSGGTPVSLLTFKRAASGTWVDLTIGKRRLAGAWVDVLPVGPLTVSASPSDVTGTEFRSEPGAPSGVPVTSDPCTATASGGSGAKTFAWTKISGSAVIVADSPTSATTTFSGNVLKNAIPSAVFRVTVTDSTGSATADVTVSLESVAS